MSTTSGMEAKAGAAPLMISVAGIRGIVGRSLTPPVIARFAGAFAAEMGSGPIVVGRDARLSGPMVYRAVAAGLTAAGRDVIDLGLATTPTTEIAVEELHAAGGIILTASHNPSEWNALKLLNARGEFLDAATGGAVRRRAEAGEEMWVEFDRLGRESSDARALEWHMKRVLELPFIDRAAIRKRHLKVVVDGCASVGGIAVPRLLRELGCDVVELDCEPTGNFTRELEPLPEHLGGLCEQVKQSRADFGIAVDPDADRAAFVDAQGKPLGEEYSLALAAQVVLAKQPGPVVTNLSTSRIMDSVCARAGVALHRTPVGEAHVVAGMRTHGAVIGGEGNGGVILPAAHHGRDGLVAAALVCEALTGPGTTIRSLADGLPPLSMLKSKLARPDESWERTSPRLEAAFPGYQADRADGLRLSRDEEWVHIRASGTEPVVRVIAESPAESRTRELIDIARRVLQPA